MSPKSTMKSLLHDMNADVQAYRSLLALLDAQFTAALAHDSNRLAELAEEIITLVKTLETHRRDRVGLVQQLLAQHPQPSIGAVLELLPMPTRGVMTTLWHTLENLVREAKERNGRNGRLMTDQHALFQRVLLGEEEHTYAAA